MSLASWKVRAGMPAALVLAWAVATPAFGQTSTPVPGGGNVAPVITAINAVQVPGQKFRIYGTVSDDTPTNCSVAVSGAASGVALCDASGNFDSTFDVATPGQITAVASDGQLSSQPSTLTLTNAAPTTTINAVSLGGEYWRFSGTVTDEAPAGLVVSLSGVPGLAGATSIVLADGSWSVTVTLPIGASGTAKATVTDWYGLTGTAYRNI